MKTLFRLKQVFYSIAFNAFEFLFFFSSYWWWKYQFSLVTHYRRTSGYSIYLNEKHFARDLAEENFSFGETTALSTKLLLQEVNPVRGSVVYDLGSGRGSFLFSSYFLYDLRGVGIELFPTYVEKSCSIQKTMKTGGIYFRQGNICSIDVSQADIVYLAGATFQESVLKKVRENLRNLRPGAVVIIIRQTLPEEDFVLFNEGDFPFSWGTDHVYFYRRKEYELKPGKAKEGGAPEKTDYDFSRELLEVMPDDSSESDSESSSELGSESGSGDASFKETGEKGED